MVRVARAFDMDVVAWSHNLTADRATEAGARLVGRDELFRVADIVSIHLRLSARTRGLVDEAVLAVMKPGAFLVNTSRAEIVDPGALRRVLARRGIAGAALDVYETEPLPPGHPLLDLPGTVLTPHLGYVTREKYELYYQDALPGISGRRPGTGHRTTVDD